MDEKGGLGHLAGYPSLCVEGWWAGGAVGLSLGC